MGSHIALALALSLVLWWPGQAVTTTNHQFVRWGRIDCPEGTDLIYAGQVAGAHYVHQGSTSDVVCLPEPETAHFAGVRNVANQNGNLLYKAEYQTSGRAPLSFDSLHDNEIPCAVCVRPNSYGYMEAGRIDCPTGFHTEYEGWLMAEAHHHQGPRSWTCVDSEAVIYQHSNPKNQDGCLFYTTEAEENFSRICPAYGKDNEVRCSVCSKIDNSGTVYVRWGHDECDVGNKLYQGCAAGGHHLHKGGGAEWLCLNPNPSTTGGLNPGNHNGALLYGTEYQFGQKSGYEPGIPKHDLPMACVLCDAQNVQGEFTYYGHNTCPEGDDNLYGGVVMGPWHNHVRRANFICVDTATKDDHQNPIIHTGNEDGSLLYPGKTEGRLTDFGYTAGDILQCARCGSTTKQGPVYVRWGSDSCGLPDDELMYTGVTASAHHGHLGSGNNVLCLPPDPEVYGNTEQQYGSILYPSALRDTGGIPEVKDKNDHIPKCSLCRNTNQTEIITQFGHDICPKGYKRVYNGFAVGPWHAHKRTDMICMSWNYTTHGPHAGTVGLLYPTETETVETPYSVDFEVSCVVCSSPYYGEVETYDVEVVNIEGHSNITTVVPTNVTTTDSSLDSSVGTDNSVDNSIDNSVDNSIDNSSDSSVDFGDWDDTFDFDDFSNYDPDDVVISENPEEAAPKVAPCTSNCVEPPPPNNTCTVLCPGQAQVCAKSLDECGDEWGCGVGKVWCSLTGLCVNNNQECIASYMPPLTCGDGLYQCADNSCQRKPSACVAALLAVEEAQVTVEINPTSAINVIEDSSCTGVRCWNGLCKSSKNECPSLPACPPGWYRCLDGLCMEASCSTVDAKVAKCPEGSVLCTGGICYPCETGEGECDPVASCPDYDGCAPPTPYMCPDGFCSEGIDYCPSCPTAGWVRCADGKCVESQDQCVPPPILKKIVPVAQSIPQDEAVSVPLFQTPTDGSEAKQLAGLAVPPGAFATCGSDAVLEATPVPQSKLRREDMTAIQSTLLDLGVRGCDTSQLDSNVTVQFLGGDIQSQIADGACIAYLNEDTQEWECQVDAVPDPTGVYLQGGVGHFSRFSLFVPHTKLELSDIKGVGLKSAKSNYIVTMVVALSVIVFAMVLYVSRAKDRLTDVQPDDDEPPKGLKEVLQRQHIFFRWYYRRACDPFTRVRQAVMVWTLAVWKMVIAMFFTPAEGIEPTMTQYILRAVYGVLITTVAESGLHYAFHNSAARTRSLTTLPEGKKPMTKKELRQAARARRRAMPKRQRKYSFKVAQFVYIMCAVLILLGYILLFAYATVFDGDQEFIWAIQTTLTLIGGFFITPLFKIVLVTKVKEKRKKKRLGTKKAKYAKKKKVGDNEAKNEEDEAAEKIQAVYRGGKVREELEKEESAFHAKVLEIKSQFANQGKAVQNKTANELYVAAKKADKGEDEWEAFIKLELQPAKKKARKSPGPGARRRSQTAKSLSVPSTQTEKNLSVPSPSSASRRKPSISESESMPGDFPAMFEEQKESLEASGQSFRKNVTCETVYAKIVEENVPPEEWEKNIKMQLMQ